MLNRRRGERVALDETVELTIIERDFSTKGPFVVDETSYEFGRKYGVHLNLLLTGLRFSGSIDLDDGQEITFMVPEQQEPLQGRVMWKKTMNESEFMYGIKILQFLNRRRNERIDLDESVEMTLLDPVMPEHRSFVDEMSYGMGRRHGVHLSPRVTGLRFRSTIDFTKEQVLTFTLPSQETFEAEEAEQQEILKGTIVWKVKKDDHWLYGLQVS